MRPQGKIVNATGPAQAPTDFGTSVHTPLGLEGYQWNVTIPRDLRGSVKVVLDDRIIGSNIGWMSATAYPVEIWAISTAPGNEGQTLFKQTWNPPAANLTLDIPWGSASLEEGVFILSAKETRIYYGFDIDTGNMLWSTEPEGYMAAWTMVYHHSWRMQEIAYGKYFTTGMDGYVNAYDIKTDNKLWTYQVDDPYKEVQFVGNWPMFLHFVSDGKLF